MKFNTLWQFPVPSNNINVGVRLNFSGGDIVLKFDYFDVEMDDKVFKSGIVFESTVSHRHSSEKFTKFIKGTYDTLIEINDSEWISELKFLSPEWAEHWKIRHFAIYLDSYGLYEFIASSFKVLETNEGSLEEEK